MWNKWSYEERSHDLWILQWNCFATKKGSESHFFLDSCEFRRLEVVVSRGHVGIAATHDRKKVKEMSPHHPPSSRSSHYGGYTAQPGFQPSKPETENQRERRTTAWREQRWPKMQKSPRDHAGSAAFWWRLRWWATRVHISARSRFLLRLRSSFYGYQSLERMLRIKIDFCLHVEFPF